MLNAEEALGKLHVAAAAHHYNIAICSHTITVS
jgi:hypothetical protein